MFAFAAVAICACKRTIVSLYLSTRYAHSVCVCSASVDCGLETHPLGLMNSNYIGYQEDATPFSHCSTIAVVHAQHTIALVMIHTWILHAVAGASHIWKVAKWEDPFSIVFFFFDINFFSTILSVSLSLSSFHLWFVSLIHNPSLVVYLYINVVAFEKGISLLQRCINWMPSRIGSKVCDLYFGILWRLR